MLEASKTKSPLNPQNQPRFCWGVGVGSLCVDMLETCLPHIPEDGIIESQFYKNGNG